MFIETLEFTIPVDLCDLFSTMKKGPRSNMEFPASVNSYGTTQDANIQVMLRSNKLTFKVDGVSSDASMISKSECKTLKLAIFDVDRSLMPIDDDYTDNSMVQTSTPVSNSYKRTRDYSAPVSPPPPHKSRKSSYSDSSRNNSNISVRDNQNNALSRIPSDNVNIKQEPEDPDLIEIEPDDIEPKKEVPYMQIDYSSQETRTHTSQAALDRLSHHPSSYSQSPASSSSSFHQNVPHVQDYSEPGPSHSQHGDQSADDYLVFQEQDENDLGQDDADYDNDGVAVFGVERVLHQHPGLGELLTLGGSRAVSKGQGQGEGCYTCPHCDKTFTNYAGKKRHISAIHDLKVLKCVCGKIYHYSQNLNRHKRSCTTYLSLTYG